MVALILICVAVALLVAYMCARTPDPRQQFVIDLLKESLPADEPFPAEEYTRNRAS